MISTTCIVNNYSKQHPYTCDETKRIFFLTGNKNKINEIVEFCSTKSILSNIVGFISLDLEEIQCESEDMVKGSTEISVNKIIKATEKIHNLIENGVLNFGSSELIFIIEDTSLYLKQTQNNFPGPFIKFMKPLDVINLANGLEMMNPKQEARNSVVSTQFACVYYNGKISTIDDVVLVSGETNGSISNTLKGIDGWGFDFCFIPNSQEYDVVQADFDIELLKKLYGKTYSELMTFIPDVNFKKLISHRTKAMQNLFIELEKSFV